MKYYCRFRTTFGSTMERELVIEVPDIGSVKDGFWINDDREYTVGSLCRYWIPPSMIKGVYEAGVDAEPVVDKVDLLLKAIEAHHRVVLGDNDYLGDKLRPSDERLYEVWEDLK